MSDDELKYEQLNTIKFCEEIFAEHRKLEKSFMDLFKVVKRDPEVDPGFRGVCWNCDFEDFCRINRLLEKFLGNEQLPIGQRYGCMYFTEESE